jgi:hypothetical protein
MAERLLAIGTVHALMLAGLVVGTGLAPNMLEATIRASHLRVERADLVLKPEWCAALSAMGIAGLPPDTTSPLAFGSRSRLRPAWVSAGGCSAKIRRIPPLCRPHTRVLSSPLKPASAGLDATFPICRPTGRITTFAAI